LIDLHSHVIPALDDGPTTLDGSLEILRARQARRA
jgi:tyrosine-protein phosphatase YwqE